MTSIFRILLSFGFVYYLLTANAFIIPSITSIRSYNEVSRYDNNKNDVSLCLTQQQTQQKQCCRNRRGGVLVILNMVDSITVESITIDHEEFGEEMAGSIQRWLDTEWMPQEIHYQIGQQCKETYVRLRQNGEIDLMAIMTAVADDLNTNWSTKYNADAFVNAWDISNYVSDYITSKTGIEGCGCSSIIY